ncbi:MAG: hypothetical protein NTV86_02350 [Planctomycetota bacterium]|nr:hypothetical protein [Planctomycetota bacterium]
MNYRRAVVAGVLVAWAAAGLSFGLGGCKKPKRVIRDFESVPEAELSPVQAEVVRYATEMEGTVSVFLAVRNTGPKKVLAADVVCTVKDVAGQAIGSIRGSAVSDKGLAPNESVALHWFVPVTAAASPATVTAQVEQVTTE